MNANQFSDLLNRYRMGACTEEEKQWIENWYNERRNTIYNPLSEEEEQLAGKKIYSRIHELLAAETTRKVVPIWRRYRIAWVAASIALVCTTGYFFLKNKPTAPHPTDSVGNVTPVVQPVTPGGNKAVLTLADGSTIVLDSAANGTLTQQGKTVVLKQHDGQLIYKADGNVKAGAVAWNIIATPRGGQYQITLPDGSKVWLNALSSLRFPASFTGTTRTVELLGEAYFEVVHNNLPFVVDIMAANGQSGGGKVEVLGTHFNVNNYRDEPDMKVTLLEGKVVLKSDIGSRKSDVGSQKSDAGSQTSALKPPTSDLRHLTSVTLTPGKQGILTADARLTIDDADVEEAVAWKNGRFVFNNADIQHVMRDIARWYDVDIEYAGKVPTEKFEGEIPRSSSINEVFKILELSNVHCKIAGRKITVLP